jgi:cobalt-zinc-cadmium efflux system outer membrane protein
VLLLVPLCALGQTGLRLEDLEKMALVNHPAIAQAAAGVRAAEGRRVQAGLYPNPVLGVNGDEIASGPIIRGGEIGGFFEQRVVTGGKLGLDRRIAEQEKREFESAAEAQRLRVLSSVRMLFYQALGDQRLLELRSALAKNARDIARIRGELANIGQADRADVFSAEIDAQRAELAATTSGNARERTWRQLAAAVNNPSLVVQSLAGDLENVVRLDLEAALAKIYAESPDLRLAEAATTRSDLALKRARVEKIPDVMIRGGARYNRELLELDNGVRRPVGPEGFFDIGVQIPIFNRNQGGVAAARAESERARLEIQRTRLLLRTRLAEVYRAYQDSLAASDRYRKEMIPRAQQAHELLEKNFQQMATPYPQVLSAARVVLQLQEEYVSALVMAWQRAVEIEALLVTEHDMGPVNLGSR